MRQSRYKIGDVVLLKSIHGYKYVLKIEDMKYNFTEGEYVYYDSVSFVYKSNILGLLSDSEVKEYELYLKLKEKYG